MNSRTDYSQERREVRKFGVECTYVERQIILFVHYRQCCN